MDEVEDAFRRAAFLGQNRLDESALFSQTQVFAYDADKLQVCGLVNARNAFGGYAGATLYSARLDAAGQVTSLWINGDGINSATVQCINARDGRIGVTG